MPRGATENQVYKTRILATIKTKIHSTFKWHITKSSKFKHLIRNPFKLTLKLRPLKLTHSLTHSQAVCSPPFVARCSYSLFSGSGFSFSFFSLCYFLICVMGYCKFEFFSLSFVFVFVLFFPINSPILVIGNCFIRKGFLFIV